MRSSIEVFWRRQGALQAKKLYQICHNKPDSFLAQGDCREFAFRIAGTVREGKACPPPGIEEDEVLRRLRVWRAENPQARELDMTALAEAAMPAVFPCD